MRKNTSPSFNLFVIIIFFVFAFTGYAVLTSILQGGVDSVGATTFIAALISGGIFFLVLRSSERTDPINVQNNSSSNNKLLGWTDFNLSDKKYFSIEVFKGLNIKNRSKALDCWLQHNHGNFLMDNSLKFYLQETLNINLDIDYSFDYEYSSQIYVHENGLYPIDTSIIDFIKSFNNECELDRLAFILYSLKSSKPTLEFKHYLEIAMHNFIKSLNTNNKHYQALLDKTYVDVMILKGENENAVFYLDKTFNNNDFYNILLKNKITSNIEQLNNRGYKVKNYTIKSTNKNIE